MTDREWARAFVRCKIAGTGRRLGETVEVLVKKLAQVRRDGCSAEKQSGLSSQSSVEASSDN